MIRSRYIPAAKPLALTLALLAAMPVLAQSSFSKKGLYELGAGTSHPYAYAVNAEGTLVAGSLNRKAVLWTASGEVRELGNLVGGTYAIATALNDAATVVVGTDVIGGQSRAFRWIDGNMEDLGLLVNGLYSKASGVNANGTVVVGEADDNGNLRAFRWDASNRIMVDLGTINYGSNGSAMATGVDTSGDVVVGTAPDGSEDNRARAFRWTSASGSMASLGVLDGDYNSHASAVNRAGTVVVGYSEGNDGQQAFRWTEQGNRMEGLGMLNNGIFSVANAVNADGNVVVGYARDGLDSSNENSGFRWTPETMMQSIEEWLLADSGIVVDDSMKTVSATGVNGDGSVVVGQLRNGSAYIARVSDVAGGPGSGLIDLNQFAASLSHAANAVAQPLRDADPVLHGAHGDPMGWLLTPGQTSMRLAGDFGRTDRSGIDSEQQLGEVGIAHAFSSTLQGQLAVGTTRSKQTLALGGASRTTGTYLLPELLWQAAPGLYASFSAYYSDGDLRLNRGYLNAGTSDLSYGETDATTVALRARLDWRDLWKWSNVSFTPYTSLTMSESRTDAYAETGGGFPVQWDARKDKLNVLRLGLDGSRALSNNVKLTGRVELAHRLGGDSRAKATGQITGITGFAVDSSAAQRREWLRLAAGLDFPVGSGHISATLNATTQGSAPAYWLAASYRVNF